MTLLITRLYHWYGAICFVPFGIVALFRSNPEKVQFAVKGAALRLPHWVLRFCSQFVHLTMVCHELSAGYFVLAILNNRGHFVAPLDGSLPEFLEVYWTVAASFALFVAILFWVSVAIDPSLMVSMDLIFPDTNLALSVKKRVLFQAMFGPTDPKPKAAWQTGFRWFMRYLHTHCPLTLFLDVLFVNHQPCRASLELQVTAAFAVGYLMWNFFCWWLLRVAPYPLQQRIYRLGAFRALLSYLMLMGVALALLGYVRWSRLASGSRFYFGIAFPCAAIIWATSGFAPFSARLARHQGVDPASLRS